MELIPLILGVQVLGQNLVLLFSKFLGETMSGVLTGGKAS